MDKYIQLAGRFFVPVERIDYFYIHPRGSGALLFAVPAHGEVLPGPSVMSNGEQAVACSFRETEAEVEQLFVRIVEQINDDTTHVIRAPKED